MFNHQQKEDPKKKDSKKKDPKHPFQTFAYCLIVHESPEFSQYKSLPLVPALYYVHHFQKKGLIHIYLLKASHARTLEHMPRSLSQSS